MSRREIYAAGVRIVGVYFLGIAVVGVVALAASLLVVFSGPNIPGFSLPWRVLVTSLAPSLANVLVSIVLIHKTDWCLSRIGVGAEPIGTGAA
jgi:hypothetical protein